MQDQPSPVAALADELFAYLESTDHEQALWQGDLAYLEQWDDIAPGVLAERRRNLEDFSTRAGRLTAEDGLERSILETVAFTGRAESDYLEWREELRWLNPEAGLVPKLITFLPRYALTTPEDGERYLDKLSRLPTLLDDWSEAIRRGVSVGRVPIVHLVSGTIAMIERQLGAALSAGPLGTAPAPTEWSDTDGWARLVHAAVDGPVAGALDRLRSVLRDVVLPVAPPDDRPGLVHLDGGDDLYARLILTHTTLDRSADEIHQVGHEQVARLEEEYRTLALPLLGVDDVAMVFERLRSDPQLHYHDPEVLVADANRALAKAGAAMPEWFGTLPQAPCEATSISQGPLAFYSPPARDGSKPGRFFFNTSVPGSWGTFALEATTYHEGIPGHHLQITIARESTLPRFLSDGYIAAYCEGWGLYTERLADEMGLYSSEIDRVGMLAEDSMRACRLVVDTGMHAKGWTRDEAIAYMLANSPMTATQVAGEIDRYIGMPGQALGYMMGRLEIDRIRAQAEARLGDLFDIRTFHDVVLGTGSVPLTTLRRTVEEWNP